MSEILSDSKVEVFDNRHCLLGEGALWHPLRQQLFWFDILNRKLLTLVDGVERHWSFNERVSAAGWIDFDHLLIASEKRLFKFNLQDAKQTLLIELEADNPVTRSNDGRADPWGGFWISSMGLNAEFKAGSIYRFYNNKLEKILSDLTIPNSICFDQKKCRVYFSDTETKKIQFLRLNESDGSVISNNSELLVDLKDKNWSPDGTVTTVDGDLVCAMWGEGLVAVFSSEGELKNIIRTSAKQVSCPAFGGKDLDQLFITSATESMASTLLSESDGKLLMIKTSLRGNLEPAVKI